MRKESPEMETTVLRSAPPANPVARQIPSMREENFPYIALPNGSHKKGNFAKCFQASRAPLPCLFPEFVRYAAGPSQSDRRTQGIDPRPILCWAAATYRRIDNVQVHGPMAASPWCTRISP